MKKVLRLPYLSQSGDIKVFNRPDTEQKDKDEREIEVSAQLKMLPE